MIQVTSYDWGHEGLVNNSYDGSLDNGWISHRANSAGGVSVKYAVKNYGTKTVRSYSIYFSPYNGAHEPVRCTVTDLCTKGVSGHDPIRPNGVERNRLFENAWYNHSIRSVKIDHIDVTYTDGTTESCKGNYVLTAEEAVAERKSDNLKVLAIFAMLAAGLGLLWWMVSYLLEMISSIFK